MGTKGLTTREGANSVLFTSEVFLQNVLALLIPGIMTFEQYMVCRNEK